MKLLSKEEMQKKVGNINSLSNKRESGLCHYMAGVPEMDEKIDASSLHAPKPIVNFIRTKTGFIIAFMQIFKMHYVALLNEQIKSITIEKGDVIDVEKQSVLKRAIVGGLIFGPLGALVGGITAGTNELKDSDMLIITVDNEGTEEVLLFQLKKNKFKGAYSFFKQVYPALLTIST